MIDNKNVNILILSAGRRVELIKIWKRTLNKLVGKKNKVFACDLNSIESAACFFSDEKFDICHCLDKEYSDLLLRKCIEKDIKIIIPTIDTELEPLAKIKRLFYSFGINIIISELDFINQCSDKRKTEDLFKSRRIKTPKIFDRNNLNFPCFMKPAKGSSSKGARKISNSEDLSNLNSDNKNYIFQEFINQEFDEFSLDLYYDKQSYLKCCVPRQRIEVRNGEISKGIIKKNKLYSNIINDFDYLEGALGVITLQVFYKNYSSNYIAIEINPRFGGGYPMSHYSGVDFPSMLIREYLLNQEISFQDDWEQDLLMLRYDSMISIKNKS